VSDEVSKLQASLRKVAADIYSNTMRQEGSKRLFDAASFCGDGEEAQRQRETLHALLDQQLDNTASSMTIARRLQELGAV
jgi:hypothetical protein